MTNIFFSVFEKKNPENKEKIINAAMWFEKTMKRKEEIFVYDSTRV